MDKHDQAKLLERYPNPPKWILSRPHTLKWAMETMACREQQGINQYSPVAEVEQQSQDQNREDH